MKFKKILSIILSLVILSGMAEGFSVFAASSAKLYIHQVDGIYMKGKKYIGYDKNGQTRWKTIKKDHFSAKTIDAENGTVAYCIEPGVDISPLEDKGSENDAHLYVNSSGYSYTSGSDGVKNYWEAYDKGGYNYYLKSDQVKEFIGLIIKHGYNGKVTWDKFGNYKDAKDNIRANIREMVATQILIWETMIGERDSSFEHKSHSGPTEVLECFTESAIKNDTMDGIKKRRNRIAENVQEDLKVPSFSNKDKDKAKVYALNVNSKNASLTLKDDNGVSKNYDYKIVGDAANKKLELNPSGNSVTITNIDNAVLTGTVTIKGTYSNYAKSLGYWGTLNSTKLSSINTKIQQTCVEPSGNISRTVYFKVNMNLGSLKITKSSTNSSKENFTFKVTGPNGFGKTYTISAKDGSAGSKTIENLPVGKYTVKETTSNLDARYYVKDKTQTVEVKKGSTASVSFNNVLKRIRFKIVKKDSLTDSNTTLSGDQSLAGLQFTVSNGTTTKTYTTDSTGVIEYTDWFPLKKSDGKDFTYTITETASGRSKYGWKENKKKTTVSTSGITATDTTKTLKFKNDPIEGKIKIHKYSDLDGKDNSDTYEKNAKFQIYLKSAGSYDKAKDYQKCTITTDDSGDAITKDLPYGTYVVHQTAGLDTTSFCKDFDVKIEKDNQTYTYKINNIPFSARIKIVKRDADKTDKIIPLSGATFTIKDSNGKSVELGVGGNDKEFITDATGCVMTQKNLLPGEYTITEIKAPAGYIIGNNPSFKVNFTKADMHYDATVKSDVVTVEVKNIRQRAKIKIKKVGIGSYTVAGPTTYNYNGGAYEQYQINASSEGQVPLKGAEYGVYASEDIYYPWGELYAKKDSEVKRITTDSNGVGESGLIELGTYYLKEITAPAGYAVDTTKHPVTIEYNAAGDDVIELDKGTLEDEFIRTKISLEKELEKDETYKIGYGDEYKDVKFGVFLNEDTMIDGTLIPAGSLVNVISIDENGYGETQTSNGFLPITSYIVREIQAPEHYILDSTDHAFTFVGREPDSEGIIEVKYNNGQKVVNKIGYGSIMGRKVDADDPAVALEGAKFGIFNEINGANIDSYDNDKALATATSDVAGNFIFNNVPYGNYVIKEIKAPISSNAGRGYVLETKEMCKMQGASDNTIRVSKDNKNITLENFANKLSGCILNIVKTSDDSVISNVPFRVYDKETGGALYDKVFYTDKEGKVSDIYLDGSIVYTVHELPGAGYREVKDQDTDFSPEKSICELDFHNETEKADIDIVKTSDDDKVEGVTFTLSGSSLNELTFEEMLAKDGLIEGYTAADLNNDKDLVLKTDKDGKIHITLPVGNYRLHEDLGDTINSIYKEQGDMDIIITPTSNPGLIQIHNSLKTQPVKIIKTADDGKVEGFKFNVHGYNLAGEAYDKNYTTDKNGIIEDNLVAGTYTISEVENDKTKGYIIPSPQTIEVEESDEVIEVPFHNKNEVGALSIQKTSDNGKVDGFTFNIKGQSYTGENVDKNVVTDENGLISETLLSGIYTVKEVENEATKGYKIPSPVEVEVYDEASIILNMHNTVLQGSLTIRKTSETEKVDGFTFNVSGTSVLGEEINKDFITDENGIITTELYNGEYTVKEVENEDTVGYILPQAQSIQISDNDIVLDFHNKVSKALVTVEKKSKDGNIEGIEFNIKGTTVRGVDYDENIVTDGQGIISQYIPAGEYTISEVAKKSLKKYVIPESQSITINDKDTTGQTIIFENKLKEGTLVITKSDVADGTLLPNAGFRIRNEDGKVVKEGRTNSKGIAKFTLTYGKYTYEEFDAPKGYVIDTTPHKFEISQDGQIVKAKMTNKLAAGTLIITKSDVADGKLLPNAGFRIRNSKGEVVKKGYTDKKGVAKFVLPVGKYTYEEFDAPKGYKIDTTKHKFEIKKDGQIVKAKMTNKKTSTPTSPKMGDLNGTQLPMHTGTGKIILFASILGCVVLLLISKKRGLVK